MEKVAISLGRVFASALERSRGVRLADDLIGVARSGALDGLALRPNPYLQTLTATSGLSADIASEIADKRENAMRLIRFLQENSLPPVPANIVDYGSGPFIKISAAIEKIRKNKAPKKCHR